MRDEWQVRGIRLNPSGNGRGVALNHQPLNKKGKFHMNDINLSCLQLYSWDRGPKELTISCCHQFRVRPSDNKAHSCITTHHAAIKVNLEKSWGFELPRDENPMGRSMSQLEVQGNRSPQGYISRLQLSHLDCLH